MLPHVVEEKTAAEYLRKLRYVHDVLQVMKDRGEIDTSDPAKFAEREVYALDTWMKHPDRYRLLDEKRERKQKLTAFDPEYRKHLWVYIAGFLAHSGNPILERMRDAGKWRPPKAPPKAKVVKDEAWFRDTMAKLETMEGWKAAVVRFATAFYWLNADRSKELRLADIEDMDLRQKVFRVMHPKGEGRYGVVGAEVDLLDEFLPYAEDFLATREDRLRKLGLDPAKVRALVPNRLGKHYDENGWSGLRYKVFRQLGIAGNYRILRKSSLQNFMDALEDSGEYHDTAIVELEALRGRHSVATALTNYVQYKQSRVRKAVQTVSRGSEPIVSVERRPTTAAERLEELGRMEAKGLISAEEYEAARKRLLDALVSLPKNERNP